MILPAAILSPNLGFIRRIELRLEHEPSGVFAAERSWGLLGSAGSSPMDR